MYITFFVKVLFVDDVSRSHFKCLASNLFRVTDLNSKIPVKSSSYIYIEGVAKVFFLHFWSRSKHSFQIFHYSAEPQITVFGDFFSNRRYTNLKRYICFAENESPYRRSGDIL